MIRAIISIYKKINQYLIIIIQYLILFLTFNYVFFREYKPKFYTYKGTYFDKVRHKNYNIKRY